MKLYRFTARAFHNGRIIEPGEEVVLADDNLSGAHIVDVAAEANGTFEPTSPPEHPPVFRPDLAHSAAMPIAPPVVMSFGNDDPSGG